MTRQAFGPIGLMKNHATDARKNPTPKPRLHQADALAAVLVGPQLGDDRGAGHPFGADATPTRKRRTANDIQSQANALKPVMIE